MKIKALPPSREVLAALDGKSVTVVATFSRCGVRKGGHRLYHTVLLTAVRNASTGELLTDHLWFNQGSVWRKAHLAAGDVVTFTARAIEYRTGYWGPNRVRQALEPARRDYRLTPPAAVRIVAHSRANRGEAA